MPPTSLRPGPELYRTNCSAWSASGIDIYNHIQHFHAVISLNNMSYSTRLTKLTVDEGSWKFLKTLACCVHCHKPTFWGFLCECNRQHGTPGDWVWICEDNSQCHLCPHCLQPADDILTCPSSCFEVFEATTSTCDTDGSDQAVCDETLVPSGMRAKGPPATTHCLVLLDLKFVLVVYKWRPPDEVTGVRIRQHASELIDFLLKQDSLQLGLICTLTSENATKVAVKLLEATTGTTWARSPDYPDAELCDENGSRVLLFDESLCSEPHPEAVGISKTPMHIRNLSLVLSACEPLAELPPRLRRRFCRQRFLFVTYDSDDEWNCYIDKASQRSMLAIKWWNPDQEEDNELQRLQRYLDDNFVKAEPQDVQEYLEHEQNRRLPLLVWSLSCAHPPFYFLMLFSAQGPQGLGRILPKSPVF